MPYLLRISRVIGYRVFHDLFMSSRLDEYAQLLAKLGAAGYSFLSIDQYAQLISLGEPIADRVVILRHDIDTDTGTARRMFHLEKEQDIQSNYFFRLSTLDYELMGEISSFGSEVSYHFEEIATVAKKRGLRSRQEVMKHMPEIQDLFARNLIELRRKTGLPMTTVASHGDFVNRALGMPNQELLVQSVRTDLGILFEVYDSVYRTGLTVRITDRPPPTMWYPESPLDAASVGSDRIYILVHPKQWHASIPDNLKELMTRVTEGILYSIRAGKTVY